jgi:predicted RNase H-like nuclease (RuvC/YqgF family)
MELKKREKEFEALKKENSELKDQNEQSKLEVIEAQQMVEAMSVLPSIVQQQLSSFQNEIVNMVKNLRRTVEQRDCVIANLRQELKATKKDLAGVCWVQSQLLNEGL